MIVRVRVVLKRTVVGDWRFDNLTGSHLQGQVNSVSHFIALLPGLPKRESPRLKMPFVILFLPIVLKRMLAFSLSLCVCLITEHRKTYMVKNSADLYQASSLKGSMTTMISPLKPHTNAHTERKQRTEGKIYTRNWYTTPSCLCHARAAKQSTKDNWDFIMSKFQPPRTVRKQRTEGKIHTGNIQCLVVYAMLGL